MSERPSDRWEHGSEHALVDALVRVPVAPAVPPWRGPSGVASFYGSGRDAMRALLLHGAEQHGWQRLFVPAYFCQEVVRALIACGVEILVHHDDPREPGIDLERLQSHVGAGDAVLVANTFGLRSWWDADEIRATGAAVIEDHTHDPWSSWANTSNADYALASLRKTLPLPDGGVLWSPRGHRVPSQPAATQHRELASARKLAAMWIKRLYLAGHSVEKEAYRVLFAEGEAEIASGAISGMPAATLAMMRAFPVSSWRTVRRSNHEHLRLAIAGAQGVDVLTPAASASDDVCPFSLVCVLPSRARRDHVRVRLAQSRIYAAVLWPLDELAISGIPVSAVELGDRSLSLHCDMRYGPEDLDRVAACLRDAAAEPIS